MSESLTPKPGLTLRATGLGLALVLVWLLYDCTLVVHSAIEGVEVLYLIGFGAIFTVFVVGFFNNLVDESRRLSKGELTVIYAMVAVAIPFGILVRASLEGPMRAALTWTTPGDRRATWLTALWRPQSSDALDMFALGGLSPGEIPWRYWIVPMAYWGAILASFQCFAVFTVLLFRRVFVEEEKLPFPMAQVSRAVIDYRPSRVDTESGRRMAMAVRVAFILGLFVCLPAITSISPDTTRPVPMASQYYGTSTGIIQGLSVSLSWDPFVLAFLMFFPVDVLFTAVVVHVGAMILVPMVCLWLGVKSPPMGEYVSKICGVGGLAGLAFWTVFFNRRTLWRGIRAVVAGGEEKRDEPLSMRVVVVGLVLSFAVFTALFIAGIIDWQKPFAETDFGKDFLRNAISVAVCLAVLVIMLLAIMRQMGEQGWHFHSPWSLGMAVAHAQQYYMGKPPLAQTQATYLSLGHLFNFGAYHNTFAPHLGALYSLKVASDTGTKSRDVVKAVFLTILVVLIVAMPLYLIAIHYYGFDRSATKNRWGNFYNYEQPMGNIAYAHKSAYFNRVPAWLAIGLGMTLVGVVMYLRRERVGFPFSPVGLVMAAGGSYFGNYSISIIWFGMIIVLVAKSAIFKWFGVRFFRERVIPVVMMAMMGLMTGMLIYKVLVMCLGQGFLRPY